MTQDGAICGWLGKVRSSHATALGTYLYPAHPLDSIIRDSIVLFVTLLICELVMIVFA